MRLNYALAALITLVTAAFGADLYSGTWKLIPAKSTNNWGQKAPQSMTRTYTPAAGGGYDVAVEGINGEGGKISNKLQAATNGEVAIGNPNSQVIKMLGATHVQLTRVDDSTLVAKYMKDGKQVGTSTSKVSGKTLRMVLEGTSTDGKKLSGVTVYEKQ